MVRARTAVVLVLGMVLVGSGAAYYVVSTATGSLAIRIHDSPSTWSHLTVSFAEVAVHPANVTNSSQWVTLKLETTRIDFLELGNLTQLLALDRVAPGKYTQVRIIVSAAEGILSTGAPVTLSVPDGVLRTITPFTVYGGGTTTVSLDLDLARSVHQANGVWIFSPVLGPITVS